MITIVNDFNLRSFNTFRLDASCRQWIEYTSPLDIPAIMAQIGGGRFINIGAGSNMLFERDFDGAVLHSRILDLSMEPLADGRMIVRAGAGIEMDSLILQLCEAGLWGLENLSGIPGDVGASAVQNVGAYGVEAADAIVKVECFDTVEGRFIELSAADCDYAYRYSMFKHPDNKHRYLITFVSFAVSVTPSPKISYGSLKELQRLDCLTPLQVRDAIISIRNSKLPKVEEIGSAGSFFKNPVVTSDKFEEVKRIIESDGGDSDSVPHYVADAGVKIPAAWLIDQCGLKGAKCGGAAVWHKQPLVIVNATGHATAADILSLEQKIINTVSNRFGIRLEPEVEHIG